MGNIVVENIVLELKNISKRFTGTQALSNVSLSIEKGTVHAVIGENGAGKSTLMNIVGGELQQDSGELKLFGKTVSISSPIIARSLGISMVYQEINLVPWLSIAENIFLGHHEMYSYNTIVNRKTMRKQATILADKIGLTVPVSSSVFSLSTAEKQLVEIARAIALDSRIIIMDEPNSGLSPHESERMFDIIDSLRLEGKTIIYVSHKLDEVLRISNRISVLRDGFHVETIENSNATEQKLILGMVGREVIIETIEKKIIMPDTPIVLRTENLSLGNVVRNASISLRKGEILGLAGLPGAGREEFLRLIYGILKKTSGSVLINEKSVPIISPENMIKLGLGFSGADRRSDSIVPELGVGSNIIIGNTKKITRFGWLQKSRKDHYSTHFINRFGIKTPDADMEIKNLSGGNQQKAVLARWEYAESSIR